MADTVRAMAARTVQWPYELAKAYMAGVPEGVRDELASAYRRLPSLADDLRRYAQRVLDGGGDGVSPYRTLGVLTRAQSTQVAALTGQANVAAQVYDWTLDAAAVGHIARKHGSAAQEAARGQLAVSASDYALLPRILADSHTMQAAGVSDIGRPVVSVRAELGAVRYEAIFEIRPGRRMLALQSMWKRPAPRTQRP